MNTLHFFSAKTEFSSIRFFGASVTRVDKEKRQILGFSVARKGPAVGHGEYLDDVALDQIVALGQSGDPLTGPVRCRMDHPEMFSLDQTLEKKLGRLSNFRRDGDVVRADLQLYSSAAAPKGDQLLALAAEAPEEFGASIVFKSALKKSPSDPVRIKNLFAVDFVDTPAANPTGLFSAGTQQKPEKKPMATKLAALLVGTVLQFKVGDTEYEVDVPASVMPKAHQVAGDTKLSAGAGTFTQADIDKAVKEAVESKEKYANEFSAALVTAKIEGKAADEFRKQFYGRPIEDVKFLASCAIGQRATGVGEGNATETAAEKAAKEEKAAEEVEIKRFAAEPQVRQLWTANSDPNSQAYKDGLARFLAANKKWAADEKAGKHKPA